MSFCLSEASKKAMSHFSGGDQDILEDYPWISSLIQIFTIFLSLGLLFFFALSWKENWISQKALLSVVSGNSMNSTLSDGQLLYSQSSDSFSRQDIVCLKLPEAGLKFPGTTEDEMLVKRIIGLPGEHLRIDSGSRIYIGEEYLWEPYLEESSRELTFDPGQDRIMEIDLGENEYFVLGDNRGNSLDSRAFGPVQEAELLTTVSTSPTQKIYIHFGALLGFCVALPLLTYNVSGVILRALASAILRRKEAC